MNNVPLAETLPKINERIKIFSWDIYDSKSKTEGFKSDSSEFNNIISNHHTLHYMKLKEVLMLRTINASTSYTLDPDQEGYALE